MFIDKLVLWLKFPVVNFIQKLLSYFIEKATQSQKSKWSNHVSALAVAHVLLGKLLVCIRFEFNP